MLRSIGDNLTSVSWNRSTVYQYGSTVVHRMTVFRSLSNNNKGNNPLSSNLWKSLL